MTDHDKAIDRARAEGAKAFAERLTTALRKQAPSMVWHVPDWIRQEAAAVPGDGSWLASACAEAAAEAYETGARRMDGEARAAMGQGKRPARIDAHKKDAATLRQFAAAAREPLEKRIAELTAARAAEVVQVVEFIKQRDDFASQAADAERHFEEMQAARDAAIARADKARADARMIAERLDKAWLRNADERALLVRCVACLAKMGVTRSSPFDEGRQLLADIEAALRTTKEPTARAITGEGEP